MTATTQMKVADIRPDELMAGQRAAMQADIDWLAARRPSFVAVHCPACGENTPEPLYEKFGMPQVRCAACRTQYVSPRPDQLTLAAFYAQSANYAYWARHIFPASKEARRDRLFRPRALFVAGLARRLGLGSGTLVEVGAAYGQFCTEIRETGAFKRIIAIEPTPDLANLCRAAGLETIESPYEAARLDGGADVVACFEVIEHLFDPSAFMRWAHDILKPGGALVLTCPNSAGFETLILGRHSDAVDHEHINLFTPQSLSLLARRSGFVEIEVTTPGELDVDLVKRALAEGRLNRHDVPEVISALVENAPSETLQTVIREARLSSNTRLVARRQAAE